MAGSAAGAVVCGCAAAGAGNPDGTPLFVLEAQPSLYAAALLLASLSGLLAAFCPGAARARLDPVVAIRG